MHTVGVGALVILLYVNPLLVLILWIARFNGTKPVLPSWRVASSRVSLSFLTIALLTFWLPTLTHAYPHPEATTPLRLGFRISLTSAAAAIITAMFSIGWGRIVTALCALIVPLNWIMWAAFQ